MSRKSHSLLTTIWFALVIPAVLAGLFLVSGVAHAAADVVEHQIVNGNHQLAISQEFGGGTVVAATPVNPGEGTFSTAGNGSSGEGNFTTGGNDSGEHQFTTSKGDDDDHGGGGGGGRRRKKTPSEPPAPCGVYLQEYIRLGAANNPLEVRKLQAFLNVFENESLPITGYYSQADYDAVTRFQAKYGQDVLGPWGIQQPTGYVFITTTMAINNIFCNRSTDNDLNLRNFYPEVYQVYREQPTKPFVQPEHLELPTVATTSEMGVNVPNNQPNIFQLAAAGLLNLFDFNTCSSQDWIIILLLIIIALLLYMVYRLNRQYRAVLATLERSQRSGPVLPGEEIVVADEVSAHELSGEDEAQSTLDKLG